MTQQEMAAQIQKRKQPSKKLAYFLLILVVGAVLMTTSMAASTKNREKTLSKIENIFIQPDDYKFISLTIDENSTICLSYVSNSSLNVYLVPSTQDINYSVDIAQRNVDIYQLTSNGTITRIPVPEAGNFNVVLDNRNKINSALISSLACEEQWSGMPSIPTPAFLAYAFYTGIMLSLLGTLLFVIDQFVPTERWLSFLKGRNTNG